MVKKKSQAEMPMDDILAAVEMVKTEINSARKRLEAIATAEEAHPIMVEGRTHTGFDIQTMIDPKIVAKIMLKYDYPLWTVLDKEVSPSMWDEIAEIVGVDSIYGVDL